MVKRINVENIKRCIKGSVFPETWQKKMENGSDKLIFSVMKRSDSWEKNKHESRSISWWMPISAIILVDPVLDSIDSRVNYLEWDLYRETGDQRNNSRQFRILDRGIWKISKYYDVSLVFFSTKTKLKRILHYFIMKLRKIFEIFHILAIT